ncbi:hypothetical protein [Bacillus sp. KH172YL63]|uniref:hypothetical protein n=1 Tax=Bacillus sp. KH172YL63 TaxID=2709784 RepID=UPI00156650C8|nr:hypothetical protein [Bacillus sp. KH172YL63]
MEKKKCPWTPAEEKLLKEIVQDHIERGKSKKEAFIAASSKINRSPGTCSQRYYKKINSYQTNLTLEACIEFLRQAHAHRQLLKERDDLLSRQTEMKKQYHTQRDYYEKMMDLLSILKKAENE